MEEDIPMRGGTGKFWAIIVVLILLVALFGVLWYTKAPEESIIARIERTGKLVVATEAAFPPFELVDPGTNQIVGFDVDIAKEIADAMGVELEMRNMGFQAIFTAVNQGTVDMGISAMTITAEREELVDFSQPYFFSNLTILALASAAIDDPNDLDGLKISLQEGTTSDFWVEDVLIGEMGINPSEIRKTVAFTDAVQLTVSGETDATIIDEPAAQAFVDADPNLKIAYLIATNEAFGVAVPPGETVLLGIVNQVIQSLRDTGKYDDIVADWFG